MAQFEFSRLVTRSQLFSQSGKLIGHYRVAGSLRLQAAFVKRLAGNIRWDEEVSDNSKGKLEKFYDFTNKSRPETNAN